MKHFLKYDYGLWTLELVTLLVHSVSFFNSLFQRAYFDQRRAKPPIRPWLGTMYQLRPMYHVMGIATGQVQVGFLYIRTRSTGLYPLPESGPFNKRVFFCCIQTQPVGLHGVRRPRTKIINLEISTNPKSHSQNIHVIFLAITAFSWQFSCHPNGCQDLTN